MAAFFQSLEKTLTAGVVLLIAPHHRGGPGDRSIHQDQLGVVDLLLALAAYHDRHHVDGPALVPQLRADPTVPKIEPAEHRAAITKFIAPNVLFWFRYSALATVVLGLILAWQKGYIVQALTFQKPVYTIGIGMLALIMAFNVWFIIWPNQQKVLGLVEATADQKAAAGRLPA